MRRGWQWPLLIGLALAFTVGVNVVMLFAAGADPNGTVVEPDYYRKAVEWDRTMARRAASAALGWTATATLGPAAPTPRTITVELRDASGAPIVDANVSATLIHNREASTPIALALSSAGDGRYAAMAAMHHAGQWEVRIIARRGPQRFETSLRAEAP
jgi:nitrogen fixation protein FixH